MRWLVKPVDQLMQSERDLVRMRCAPGNNALEFDCIVGDGANFHELGFDDFRGSHTNSRMAHVTVENLCEEPVSTGWRRLATRRYCETVALIIGLFCSSLGLASTVSGDFIEVVDASGDGNFHLVGADFDVQGNFTEFRGPMDFAVFSLVRPSAPAVELLAVIFTADPEPSME